MNNHENDLFFMAKNGDISAYEKLIEPYERKIFSVVLAAVGNKMEASGFTQDIFVNVFLDLKHEESENKFSLLIYRATRTMLQSKCKNIKHLSVNGYGFNMV